MTKTPKTPLRKSKASGFSLVELLIVIVIIGILSAVAIPNLIASRRAIRVAAVPRVIFTELRYARQQAMAQQQAISFLYNNNDKTIRIFGGSFGNQGNSGNKLVSLAGGGLSPDEIVYGIPAGLPTVALGDGTANAALPQNNQVALTFRPYGTLRLPDNSLQSYALFVHNRQQPADTASAVSILGASGRVKLWKYSRSANRYAE